MLRTEKGNPLFVLLFSTHNPAKDDDDSISFVYPRATASLSLSPICLPQSLAIMSPPTTFSLPHPHLLSHIHIFPSISALWVRVIEDLSHVSLSSFSVWLRDDSHPLTDAGIECNNNKLLSLPRHQPSSLFSLYIIYSRGTPP